MNDRRRWAGPYWDGWGGSAECRIVELVDEEAKEGGGLFVRIILQLLVDIDDKSRGDSAEQTSLGGGVISRSSYLVTIDLRI